MDVPAFQSPPATILVIEDDARIATMLTETLDLEGYEPLVANSGEEGVRRALHDQPQLVICDLMLPGMDGFEVVRQLRASPRTRHIPILVLSARDEVDCKVRALELANDYLTKPFDTNELLARIRAQLRLYQTNMLSALTGLPSGLAVEDAINSCLRTSAPWAILYPDLDHFKAYNDRYGPLAGNNLIRLLARIIEESSAEVGTERDFLGHIGGDDFVVITAPERAEPVCHRIEARWDVESKAFYTAEDLSRGTLASTDRQGRQQVFPLVGVSIGVVTNAARPIVTREEFSRVAAETKHQAKLITGSSHFIDRRASSHERLPTPLADGGPNDLFQPLE